MSGTAASKPPEPRYYYYCLKFSLSVYSMLFLISGFVILCIGAYAEAERMKLKTIDGIFLAPAIILLLLGIVMFSVSFIGMVGSLRDNLMLLKIFFWVLLVIFVIEVVMLLVNLLFESQMKTLIHTNIREGIKHYYDDLDFKNILDFIQEKFECCGGDEFGDWKVNNYHSCNSTGPLACGVPYTCCVVRKASSGVKNTLCGFQALNQERLQLTGVIHVRGCVHAVMFWFKDNFGVTIGLIFGILIPQVLGLIMTFLFWSKVTNFREFDTVDCGIPLIFDFKALDLSGAGWCLCLPRDDGYIRVNVDGDDPGDGTPQDNHTG
ncbi:tetraspanin-15-like isoform X1 [Ambystoma mexicanum]|uniref:tetraspanin-15-like isoform X1 n=1 Tax=Ambystoma mexicanum TaxID=8296 RepID=UPI0037E99235